MKKLIALTIALILCMSLASCDPAEPAGDAGANTSADQAADNAGDEDQGQADAGDGTLGDYKVEILSARIVKDYEDKDAIAVKFSFTNNSDDATSFMVATHAQAFQNGVELDTGIITGDKEYDSGASMKDVKPGSSIELESAYVLGDTSEVEIEVSELISFSDAKVTKTFNPSEL